MNSVTPLPPLLLTIPEAAKVISCGTTKTRELIALGQLEVVRIGKKSVRVPAQACADFVQRLREGAER
jgi:excisionase family DNA binding protein